MYYFIAKHYYKRLKRWQTARKPRTERFSIITPTGTRFIERPLHNSLLHHTKCNLIEPPLPAVKINVKQRGIAKAVLVRVV